MQKFMSGTNETYHILTEAKVSITSYTCLYNSEHKWKTREKSQINKHCQKWTRANVIDVWSAKIRVT